MSGKRPARIEIHVAELALSGFDAGDRHRIGDALSAELTRLVNEGGLPPQWSAGAAIERTDTRADLTRASSAKAIGVSLAQAIYRGLGR